MNIANATVGGYSRSRWGGLNVSTTCTIAGLASTLKNAIASTDRARRSTALQC
jgi:hypothetical protein